MKTYKASEFARNPKPIYKEAAENGVIIQRCNTNGEVEEEFILIEKSEAAVWSIYEMMETGKI